MIIFTGTDEKKFKKPKTVEDLTENSGLILDPIKPFSNFLF
jgi:hypothetical protein